MFHFGGFPTYTYVFSVRSMVLHHGSFLIRKSTDRSLFAAPRGLSQLVTSFFGSWCQGIHLMLLFAWTSFKNFRSLACSQIYLNCLSFLNMDIFAAKRFYTFLHFYFSVLRQNCVLPFDWKDLIFMRSFYWARDSSLSSLSVFRTQFFRFIRFSMNVESLFQNTRRKRLCFEMVEMMGFEPMTPCLQGRCSPSWATPP